MSTFLYEAYDSKGALVKGEFEAAERDEVVEHLMRRTLIPVSVIPLRAANEGGFSLFNTISKVDVLFLVRTLGATIKAGLGITESLEVLIADTNKKYLKGILQKVQAGIKNGKSLSASFEEYRNAFPAAFIGLLRAGEVSGNLDKTLNTLNQYLSKEYSLRQKVRSAMIYPAVLLVASVGVIILLLIFVLPRLMKTFESSDITLPFITRFFIAISSALTYSYLLDLIVIAFLGWGVFMLKRTVRGKRWSLNVLTRVPVARDVILKVAMVRFCRTLGNLIETGISAVEALELTADSIGNVQYKEALMQCSHDIKNGVSLSRALTEHPKLFPKVLVSLVGIGEKTGTLGSVLVSLADFYENEVNSHLKDLTSILEPVLLLIMGLVVGGIALSILLPIYKLVGSFS
jgi:type IV pilus assembly protein PilC